MDPITVGVLGTLLLLVLLLMGMPIAFMMMLVGFLGIWKLSSLGAGLPIAAQTLYSVTSHYPYTIIPLFIVMGIIDTLDDMFCLIKLFRIGENLKIKYKTGGINIPLRYWRLAIIAVKAMLNEIIWNTGPLDLVDITAGGKGEHTKVRISLR